MGGGFDPFHLGHLNSLLCVRKAFQLKSLILIPYFQNPLKEKSLLSPLDRLEILRQVIRPYPFMELDEGEIKQKGLSWTWKTVARLYEERVEGKLKKSVEPKGKEKTEDRTELKTKSRIKESGERVEEELFFIMGLDQFYIFDRWKNWQEILKRVHLIVTGRAGLSFPKGREDFPQKLKPYLSQTVLPPKRAFSGRRRTKSAGQLSFPYAGFSFTEKKIYFCALEQDISISSSDIRKAFQAEALKDPAKLSIPTADKVVTKPLEIPKLKRSAQHQLSFDSKKTQVIETSKLKRPAQRMTAQSQAIKEKNLSAHSSIEPFLPQEVLTYIREKSLYKNFFKLLPEKEERTEERIEERRAVLDFSFEELNRKKAYDIKLFDLRSLPLPFAFGLIASALSARHALALALHIKRQIRARFKLQPVAEDGFMSSSSEWLALDYGELVIHIFYEYRRKLCQLDQLWAESLMEP